MLERYTFFVDDGGGETQVYPRVNTLVFNDTPDDTNKFYRKVLQTRMLFAGADYALLKAEEDAATCSVWDFIIKYETVEVFRGFIRFNTSSIAEIDVSNCRLAVKVQSSDEYTCFLREWETEFNILTGIDKVSANTLQGTIEVITCDDTPGGAIDPENYSIPITDCISPGEGWTLIDQLVNTGGGNDTVFSTYIREVITVACSGGVPVPPAGDGWILIADNCPTDADYARAVPVTALVVSTDLSVGELYRATASVLRGLTFDGSDYNSTPIDNGVLLNDILTFYVPCELTVVSDFFNINPDATAPANDAYTYASDYLQEIIVWQKSDVKRPGAANNATNGKWNYKSLLNQLRVLFNVRYQITSTTLRIEHVSYYEDALVNGEDLATDHADRIAGKHSYQTDDGRVPKAERWQFMEAVSEDFQGEPITYTCFSDESANEATYVADRVNCDMGNIMNTPDSYADDGFVFGAAYEVSGSYYLIVTESELTPGVLLLNGPLCIPNLLANLHTYERPLISGTLNGAPTTFDSAIRRKRQTALVIPFGASDYFAWNPADLVNTQIGWGEVDNASWNAATCQLTLNVNH